MGLMGNLSGQNWEGHMGMVREWISLITNTGLFLHSLLDPDQYWVVRVVGESLVLITYQGKLMNKVWSDFSLGLCD